MLGGVLRKVSDDTTFRTPSVVQAVVSMVTNWALLRRPTAQTSGKMASFSETLDLAGGRDLFLILLKGKRRWRRRRLRLVYPINRRRERQGEYLLVNQMREMDEEQHFNYFRMSKYCSDDLLHRITPYNQHQNTHSNPLQFTETRCRTRDSSIWVITTVTVEAAVAPQSHPFCEPIFLLLSK